MVSIAAYSFLSSGLRAVDTFKWSAALSGGLCPELTWYVYCLMSLQKLDDVTALIKAHLVEEFQAGFPRLSRAPSTGTIKFLDHFSTLATADQDLLLNTLARVSALRDSFRRWQFAIRCWNLRTPIQPSSATAQPCTQHRLGWGYDIRA
jgi:hypothetical protein